MPERSTGSSKVTEVSGNWYVVDSHLSLLVKRDVAKISRQHQCRRRYPSSVDSTCTKIRAADPLSLLHSANQTLRAQRHGQGFECWRAQSGEAVDPAPFRLLKLLGSISRATDRGGIPRYHADKIRGDNCRQPRKYSVAGSLQQERIADNVSQFDGGDGQKREWGLYWI